MQNALYVEINSIGVCLLLIIIFNQHQNIGSSTMQRQFNHLVFSTIAMLIVDTGCWLLDGTKFPHARTLNAAVETCYYFLNIYIPYLWVVYLEIAINKEQKEIFRKLRFLAIPVVILSIFLFVNLKTESVFIIDENNIYHRNSGYLAYAILAYVYLGYASARALIAVYRADWTEDKRRYYPMAFFTVLPAIGGIIQILYYGTTLIWVFVAISIVIMYIDSLNRQISADSLTGINNRRELTKYLIHETKDPDYKGILALLMMDADRFKQINDTYGHYYGDCVLVALSEILKQSCRNTPAFLARYGGDEFCIVYPAENIQEVEEVIAKIQSNLTKWNNERNEPVKIGLSIGYSIWHPETGETVEELYKQADQKMYQAKSAKENAHS